MAKQVQLFFFVLRLDGMAYKEDVRFIPSLYFVYFRPPEGLVFLPNLEKKEAMFGNVIKMTSFPTRSPLLLCLVVALWWPNKWKEQQQ
jgi:hypothetical protein